MRWFWTPIILCFLSLACSSQPVTPGGSLGPAQNQNEQDGSQDKRDSKDQAEDGIEGADQEFAEEGARAEEGGVIEGDDDGTGQPQPPPGPKVPRLPKLPPLQAPPPKERKPLPAIDVSIQQPADHPVNEEASSPDDPEEGVQEPARTPKIPVYDSRSMMDRIKDMMGDFTVDADIRTPADALISSDEAEMEERDVWLYDPLDFNEPAPRARLGGGPAPKPVQGVFQQGIHYSPESQRELQAFPSDKRLKIVDAQAQASTQNLTVQQFVQQCPIAKNNNRLNGDKQAVLYESGLSPRVSESNRNLTINLRGLRGYGRIEAVVQLLYYDNEGNALKKHKPDGGLKPNYTHPLVRLDVSDCARSAAQSLRFDLFSVRDEILRTNSNDPIALRNKQELSRASFVEYTLTLKLYGKSVVAFQSMGLDQAGQPSMETMHYSLAGRPDPASINLYFKPGDDLQKNDSEQVLVELKERNGQDYTLVLKGPKLGVKSGGQVRWISSWMTQAADEVNEDAARLHLDPVYWDLITIGLENGRVKLYSRGLLLHNQETGSVRYETLCLGATCEGESRANASFDELEIVNGSDPAYCRFCDDGLSAITFFDRAPNEGLIAAHHIPKEGERLSKVSAWGLAGETETISFGIHPQGSFPDVGLELTDLSGPGGQKIPRQNITPRFVKYWKQITKKLKVSIYDEKGLNEDYTELVPELVLKDDRQEFYGRTEVLRNGQGVKTGYRFPSTRETLATSLVPGENKLVWLAIDVPDGTVPGTYRGQVKVTREGRTLESIPLELTVKDIQLSSVHESAKKQSLPFLGMYFRDRIEAPGGTEHPEKVSFERFKQHAQNMRSIGLNSIELRYQPHGDPQQTLVFYRNELLPYLKRLGFIKLMMICIHPSKPNEGPPDYSLYDLATGAPFNFDVYCYGHDEPGPEGMPSELSRATYINARVSNVDYGQLSQAVGQYFINLMGLEDFRNYIHETMDMDIRREAGESEDNYRRRLKERFIEELRSISDRDAFWGPFYDQVRSEPALRASLDAAIPQAIKAFVRRYKQAREDPDRPRIAAANFKEISVWMDGCTLEDIERCVDLPGFPSDDLLEKLDGFFERYEYDDDPYKRVHTNLLIPFDILGIDAAGLDVSILTNSFDGRFPFHQEYIRGLVKKIRDDASHFPGQRPVNRQDPDQQEWFYFGNTDGKDQVEYVRFMFGYYLYITQARGAIPYVYQHHNIGIRGEAHCAQGRPNYNFYGMNINCLPSADYEDPFVDFDGLKASGRPDSEGLAVEDDYIEKDDYYVYPSAQGPIQTVKMEMIREGIKDYRYLLTAEKLIQAGNDAGAKAEFRRIIKPFQDAVINQVEVCSRMNVCGENWNIVQSQMDSARRQLADLIERLQ